DHLIRRRRREPVAVERVEIVARAAQIGAHELLGVLRTLLDELLAVEHHRGLEVRIKLVDAEEAYGLAGLLDRRDARLDREAQVDAAVGERRDVLREAEIDRIDVL